jgi:hypothetical protein
LKLRRYTRATLDYFDCIKDEGEEGKYWMRGDPAMECWNYSSPNMHTQLLPLAVFAVLMYPIGILCMFIFIFWRNRVVLRQRTRLNALVAPEGEDVELLAESQKCERRFGRDSSIVLGTSSNAGIKRRNQMQVGQTCCVNAAFG